MAGVKKNERLSEATKQLLVDLYATGKSINDISKEIGINYSATRRAIATSGIMRDRLTARRAVGWDGSRARKGIKRPPYSEEWRERMSISAIKRWDKTSKGLRTTSQGYISYTRGEMCEKLYHRVLVESFIGRKLRKDEVVHHKDGNKLNNDISNLVIMTPSEHALYHAQRRSK